VGRSISLAQHSPIKLFSIALPPTRALKVVKDSLP